MNVSDPAGFPVRDHVGLAVDGEAISFCGPAVEEMIVASGSGWIAVESSVALLSAAMDESALRKRQKNESLPIGLPMMYSQPVGEESMPGKSAMSMGGVPLLMMGK
ncbi:hypothetical protein GT37_09410 [Pseudomonas putida]|nr:hypothetical protein GT37_09410 [Pseudomonas putida]